MGRKYIDLTGRKFGKLTAIKYLGICQKRYLALWECVCDCGKTTQVIGADLRKGDVRSCDCMTGKHKKKKKKLDACIVCGNPEIKARNRCKYHYYLLREEEKQKEFERYC